MLDAAIEIGIGAFLAGHEQGDGEIEAALLARGVEPWLVARLILFVPLAIGREMLPGCDLHRMFAADGVGRLLSEEAVWRAAAQRAKRATRDERMLIGRRSSEVAAVSQFLAQYPERHGELDKLQFSMPTIAVALPKTEMGDGGVPSPAQAFRELVQTHDHLVFDQEGRELFATGRLRFGARVYPRNDPAARWAQVQVDYVVRHPALAAPHLLESFAGFGATWGDALKQTIVKFERGSLHVLLAGLLDRGTCEDQVEWEPLGDLQGRFEICMGGVLQTFGAAKAPSLTPLIDELKAALAATPLTLQAHGLRVFLSWDGKALSVIEVLLDNQAWAPGEKLAAARDWSGAEEAWGVRWFAMVTPVRVSGEAEAMEEDVDGPRARSDKAARYRGEEAEASRRGKRDEEEDGEDILLDASLMRDGGGGASADDGAELWGDAEAGAGSFWDLFGRDSDPDD